LGIVDLQHPGRRRHRRILRTGQKLAQELPGVVIALRQLDGQPVFLTSLPFGTQLKPNADGVLFGTRFVLTDG
jgi:hypothetical protein